MLILYRHSVCGGGGVGELCSTHARSCFLVCLGYTPAWCDDGYSPPLLWRHERHGVHFCVSACACLQRQSLLCVCLNVMFCYHTEIPPRAYKTSWKWTVYQSKKALRESPSFYPSPSLSVVLSLNFVLRCFQGAVSTAGTCGCTTPSWTCGSELLLWTKAAGDTRCVFYWER